MVDAAQADVILAPGYEDGVIEQLISKRKNTRILTVAVPDAAPALAIRQMADGFLVQQNHRFDAQPDDWTVVTDRQPSAQELADAAFAWRVCGHVNSNAIVLAKDGVAWGIGAGQQNRGSRVRSQRRKRPDEPRAGHAPAMRSTHSPMASMLLPMPARDHRAARWFGR